MPPAERLADQLPEAVIKLRQGFGRLIRTANDRGMVVILDPRGMTWMKVWPTVSVTGGTFTLNDSFKDLPPTGRYRLAWAPLVFFQNLEATFPDIALLPDYAAIKATYSDSKILRREAAALPGRQRSASSFQAEVVFSILDPISGASGKKYYASIDLEGQPQTIWVELYADRQQSGVQQAAHHAHFFEQPAWLARAPCPPQVGNGMSDLGHEGAG